MVAPVHVIGGGLAGSEAAWQAARAGVPRGAARDAPGPRDRRAQDRHAGRAGLLQLVPLRRRAEQRGRPAARGDAPLRLADHGARAMPTSCRRAARSRSTATASPAAVQAAIEAEPLIELRREEVAALPDACRRPGDRRDRPAHLARRSRSRSAPPPARTRSPSSTRSRRSSIARRIDFEVAWFQSRYDKAGPRRRRRRLRQLPARSGAVRGLRRGAARGREARVQGLGGARRPTSRAACRSR